MTTINVTIRTDSEKKGRTQMRVVDEEQNLNLEITDEIMFHH